MAMKQCKECGADVSSSAKVCPKCGKKLKHAGLIILLSILVFFMCILIAVGSTMPDPNISDVSQTYYIGDTVDLGDFSVKLEKYDTREKGDRIDDYSVVSDPQWIAVYLTYTNESGKESRIPRYVRLINGNGEQLEQPTLYYKVWDGEHLDNANLIDGGSKTGYLLFGNTKIDKAKDLTLQISCNSSFRENNTFNFKLTKK